MMDQKNVSMDELCQKIEKAFAHVELGDGVGLLEAQGLDDYCDEVQCARIRKNDEKYNWKNLTQEQLNSCSSSLSFFDAEGMRFHLPAYITLDLQGGYNFDLEFSMTELSDYRQQQFSMLNEGQRDVVRLYLQHLLDKYYKDFIETGFEDFSIHKIEKALENFWLK